jgi:hypothetical protein
MPLLQRSQFNLRAGQIHVFLLGNGSVIHDLATGTVSSHGASPRFTTVLTCFTMKHNQQQIE